MPTSKAPVPSSRSIGRTSQAGPSPARAGNFVSRGADSRDRSFFREFARLKIAVITPPDDEGKLLVRELQRTRAEVNHTWPAPEQLPLTADVVYCDLLPDLAQRQPSLPGDPRFALVVIVPSAKPVDLRALHDCGPHGALHHPVTPQAVITSLVVGRASYLYERRLRGRIEKLDENLRTMRVVERAKSVLMQSKGVSEEQAYHFLRRQAMERRVSIGAVATAVVDSQDILG